MAPYLWSASTASTQRAYAVQYAASGPRSKGVSRPAAASSGARRSHSCRAVGLSSGGHSTNRDRAPGRYKTTICHGRLWLESVDEVPEPHEFAALVRFNRGADVYSVAFQERDHAHSAAHRDNNMRAAIIHVLADAAVSML